MNLLKKLMYIFNKKQKIQIVGLSILIIIGALLELVGITAILPFVSVAMDANQIFENKILSFLYQHLNFSSTNVFLAWMAITLIVIYVLKNVYLVYMNNKIFYFNYDNQRRLTNRLIACYLKEPYTFFLKNNTADLLRNVREDTSNMFDTVLATMQLSVECIVSLLLLIYLMITDISITLAVGVVLVGFMLIIMRVLKKNIQKRGMNTREALGATTKWIIQMFGSIKEIKIMGSEEFFKKQIDQENQKWVENKRKYQTLAYVPKPAMETVCIGSVLFVVALKLLSGVDSTYFITTVSVFAVAAFRLLPAFNRITGYASRIMFNHASVYAVYNDLVRIEKADGKETEQITLKHNKQITFNQAVEMRNISFKYPDAEKTVLNNVSITLPKNKSIAFIGASGAGKTTLADILLGILEPSVGDILVDGFSIKNNMSLWQKKLGYIPQTIYLLDDTIKRNIAFALPDNEIDNQQLLKVMDDAQLTEFVNTLPDGIDTVIGEGGVRLSGGQRQRIGIARALYTNPEVLVLDEATSALDNETEAAVMEAIEKFSGKKTLLVIAHRLSTIKNCDVVYKVENGGVREVENTQ